MPVSNGLRENCTLKDAGCLGGSSEEWGESSKEKIWSNDLAMPGEGPQPWMLELAKMLILKDLPTGVIVGTAVIAKCEEVEDRGSKIEDSEETPALSSILNPPSSLFRWHLTDVERVKKMRKPKGHPQPVWFTPF